MSETEQEIVLKFDSEIITKEQYDRASILDAEAIGKVVSMGPGAIKLCKQRVDKLEQERFQLHQLFKREKARKILAAKKLTGDDRLTNATDRECWALIQPSVIAAMDAEVACVSELKQAKAEYEYWLNIFIAARKLETRVQQENELEIQAMRFTT